MSACHYHNTDDSGRCAECLRLYASEDPNDRWALLPIYEDIDMVNTVLEKLPYMPMRFLPQVEAAIEAMKTRNRQ